MALITAGLVLASGLTTAAHAETILPAREGLPLVAPEGAAAGIARAVTGGTVTRGAVTGGAAAEPVKAPRKTLRPGARGGPVKWLQTRLTELGYVPGKIDGRYGGNTMMAVWAFQKVQGIKPTSTVAARTWRALEDPKAPKVLVPGGRPDRVEIDLTKQLVVLYRHGEVRLISHASSGSGIPYTETTVWNGRKQTFTGSATTPTGDYKTTWRVSGWHTSYLGKLYNPIFFNGGIALHGALSVPLRPVSHGCVRLPMPVAEILPGLLGRGVPVHVRGHFRG